MSKALEAEDSRLTSAAASSLIFANVFDKIYPRVHQKYHRRYCWVHLRKRALLLYESSGIVIG